MDNKYRDVTDTGGNYKQKVRHKNLGSDNENESKTMQLKTKKRQCSEVSQENSYCSQPERKRIKLEPESDIDIRKKKTLKNDKSKQDSISYDKEYLNFRVKEEQTSLVPSQKKKKKKQSNSNIDNASQSDSTTEPNRETYLDLRVKQEQASVVEPEIVKCKKKKKHKGIVSSDMEIEIEAKVLVQDESPALDESTTFEPTEYSIIEDKFSAEDTVVEKPRKKKRKTDTMAHYNIDDDNKAVYVQKACRMTLEFDHENLDNNDISLEHNDFTCSNIVSSTILNASAIDLRDRRVNETKDLLRKSKEEPRKISDRIRFEEDDNSSQHEPQVGRTSAKINMFLKVNSRLKLSASETSKDSLITEDDEIWTLTWPHEINLEKLRNTTISSDGKCKIKIEGQTYEGVPNKDVITVTLLAHERSQAFITKLPIQECMDYHKRIPKVHIPNNNIMVDNQRNFTPLPETKCRHPLFGAHYKKAIKIPTAVVERLQAAKGRYSETSSDNIKKKKHKKDKHKSADIKTEKNCVYIKIKPENETLSKNKKRKHSMEDNGPPKKLKRINNNCDSPAVWESEQAIEENLFNF